MMSHNNKNYLLICGIIIFLMMPLKDLLAQQQKTSGIPFHVAAYDTAAYAFSVDSLLQWQAKDTLPGERYIGFKEFLAAVAAHNLDYAVQKYNISIAQAEITVAKLYPDPSLSAGWTKDISSVPANQKFGDVWNVGASETILLGNKINARRNVAEQNENVSAAQTEDFFRSLRAAAAQAYIAALIADSTYKADVRTYQNLAELVRINESRVEAGDLGKIDLVQSRVDAIQARGAVLQADAARRQAFISLGQLMGESSSSIIYRPIGNISFPSESFNLDSLIQHAKTIRPDVIAARYAVKSARFSLNLANAERVPDVTVGAGYSYTGTSTNQVAPFPGEKSLNLNVSIPLPISDIFNKGTLQVAELSYKQAQKTLAVTELKAETEVRSAYVQYQLAKQQFLQYSRDLLTDAKNVRNARLYSYVAGNASLLEVLTAENTLASVYLAYYGTVSNYINSLIILEEASGVWDIEL